MSTEDDSPPARPDDVATLLRLAGRRPAVPEEVAARVRAAVHEHWQGELRRRARARYLFWSTAALATAASVVLVVGLYLSRAPGIGTARTPAPRETFRVESLTGHAWVRDLRDAGEPGAGPRPLPAGAAVPAGAEVETGEGGRLAVRLASGHSVRLDSASRLRILGGAALALDRGAVYLDSGAGLHPAAPVSLRTALGEVEETGTQFEVRLGPGPASVRIRVREGSVVLRAAGRDHAVGALTELTADARGGVSRREIPGHGPEWAWIAGVAPMPDLAGLSARAFLDRMAREGGWTLELAGGETARLAETTLLQGSVQGLTVQEALDAVLPTCGLTHRVEGSRLIVERAAS